MRVVEHPTVRTLRRRPWRPEFLFFSSFFSSFISLSSIVVISSILSLISLFPLDLRWYQVLEYCGVFAFVCLDWILGNGYYQIFISVTTVFQWAFGFAHGSQFVWEYSSNLWFSYDIFPLKVRVIKVFSLVIGWFHRSVKGLNLFMEDKLISSWKLYDLVINRILWESSDYYHYKLTQMFGNQRILKVPFDTVITESSKSEERRQCGNYH